MNMAYLIVEVKKNMPKRGNMQLESIKKNLMVKSCWPCLGLMVF